MQVVQSVSQVYLNKSFINQISSDFPGGAMDKNPPVKSGDMDLTPGLSKIPHVVEQVSPCAWYCASVLRASSHKYRAHCCIAEA